MRRFTSFCANSFSRMEMWGRKFGPRNACRDCAGCLRTSGTCRDDTSVSWRSAVQERSIFALKSRRKQRFGLRYGQRIVVAFPTDRNHNHSHVRTGEAGTMGRQFRWNIVGLICLLIATTGCVWAAQTSARHRAVKSKVGTHRVAGHSGGAAASRSSRTVRVGTRGVAAARTSRTSAASHGRRGARAVLAVRRSRRFRRANGLRRTPLRTI